MTAQVGHKNSEMDMYIMLIFCKRGDGELCIIMYVCCGVLTKRSNFVYIFYGFDDTMSKF